MTDFTQQELEYLTAAVGPEKAGYYLPKFARFAAGGSPLSWNWPCFFVTFFWLLYRKMWLWAVLYMVLPAALFFVLGVISVFTSYWVYAAGTIVYWIGIFIVLPMYAMCCITSISERKWRWSPTVLARLSALSPIWAASVAPVAWQLPSLP